jgi:MATE family multidrug resistance protein
MKEKTQKPPEGLGRELVEGSIWKSIFFMSWPMLLIMLCNFMVGFTDIYVAGLLGYRIQAAVGFIEQLYFLLILLANAISIGSVAIVSRAAGSGDMTEASYASRQSLGFGLIIAALLTAAGLLAPSLIVSAAGFPSEIFRIAVVFLRIFSISLGFNYFLIISNAILRALGMPKKPLVSMGLYAVLNMFLDFALVFGWGPFPCLGYAGIALATTISVIVATALNLFFMTHLGWSSLLPSLFRLNFRQIRRLVSVSWPMALVMIGWNAGTVVLYNILAHLPQDHIQAMAAYANGLRLEAVIFMPAFALNMAASVLVGQNLGAGQARRAAQTGWQIAATGAVGLAGIAAPLFVFAPEVASLLTQNPSVLSGTVTYLHYNLSVTPFMAFSLTLGGGLQGAGDTRGVMMVIIFAMWVIRLPLAYLLGVSFDWGAQGVWSAMIFSMTVQGTLMALRFRLGGWKKAPI